MRKRRRDRKERRHRRRSRLWNALRGRLFFKIYLTIIACLAAVALASGIYWASAYDDDFGWSERLDHFVSEMLPADATPAQTRAELEKLARALDADIALYGQDNELIAMAGDGRPPRLRRGRADDWRHRFGEDFVSARLEDGRQVAVRMDTPWEGPGRSPILYIVLMALVIAAAAWPVVRHLTRRLEMLKVGMEQFGAGQLSARVAVKGRDEVAAVAKSFNAAADRIEALVASHRSLLANASHELRSPVARLRMAVDLAEGVDARRRGEIVESLGEIDALVEEILLASRLDHVEHVGEMERVDLLALAAEEGARQDVEVVGEPAEVNGDARLLTRLIRNLIVNGKKHGAPPVGVRVEGRGGMAVLSVRDHGAGIPSGEAERIFEPFYRPKGFGERSGGWGLGLSLVRQIAERHGGTVRAQNAAGGGCVFVVDLPAA